MLPSLPSRLPISDLARRSSRRAPRPTTPADVVSHATTAICTAGSPGAVLTPLVGALLDLLPATCAAVVTLDGEQVEVDPTARARGGARITFELEHHGERVRAAARRTTELTEAAGGLLLVLDLGGAPHRAVVLVADPEAEPPDALDRTRAGALAAAARQALTVLESRESQTLRALHETILLAIAHELRTPLTTVRGAAETLSARWRDLGEPDRERLLSTLSGTSARLEHLLGDLLDLARLDRPDVREEAAEETDRTEVDLDDLLEETLAGVVDPARHDLVVVPSGVRASVDRIQVERIVANLAGNAARHTPPGTTITVTATAVADGIELHVSDDGPGVEETERDRIFSPFERGAGPLVGPGTGIGLSLVARFAELHGGSARVEPAEEGGARFVVHLPAAVTSVPAGARA